jgi:hypothetical protein
VDGAQTSVEGILDMKEKKLSVAEFEALVNEVKGNCDGCSQDCRNRLQILDSQIEAFRNLEKEYRQRLADMDQAINHLKAVCQVCNRLNILCSNVGTRQGTQNDSEEKDINEKLTCWN